jgi:CHASE2 domain-containing sensor protein
VTNLAKPLLRGFARPQRLRLGGAALTALAGVLVLFSSALEDASYDALFRFRPPVPRPAETVLIVDMDAESEDRLGQQSILAWDRSLHVRLLEKLKELGAEAVAVDVLFRNSDEKLSSVDEQLIRAADLHGKVAFGAKHERFALPTGGFGTRIVRPFGGGIPETRVGLAEHTDGADRRIREHATGARQQPSLAWRLAEWTRAELPGELKDRRWLNYYGPSSDTFQHVSFWRVLSNDVPASIQFAGKAVFVGATTTVGPTGGTGSDVFSTPYDPAMPGVEINATAYANLSRGDWLRRWSSTGETTLVALLGGVLGFGASRRRMAGVAGFGLAAALTVLIASVLLFSFAHWWFPWLVVLAVQIPCAVAWAAFARASLVQTESVGAPSTPAFPEAPATLAPRPGASFGSPAGCPKVSDHALLRCVGRGAYGEVWLARDLIGTFHAVKLIYRNAFESDAPFEREFRGMQKYTPISRGHPGWVHVLHVGRNEAEGYFYYVMEAADDENTGQEIQPENYQPRNLQREIQRRRRIPVAECVEIGIALADALDYLHGQLLVHRDIKPSNVIYVQGAPKFTDVGLVTEVRNRDRDVSQLGTLGYMAPEGPGTAVADVYSLGKLLYEISTGRDRHAYPELASDTAPQTTAGDLARLSQIIARACENDPARRYQSAAELRDDLRAFEGV